MDKATKRQFSYLFFIAGLIMLIVPELNGLEFLPGEVRTYFSIFFYPGIVCVVIGYWLRA
ncbi:MAG: hypothetical protein WC342_07565 [Methanoregula sp.]|jgi:hypothetical protein